MSLTRKDHTAMKIDSIREVSRPKAIAAALYRLYEHSGFSMAGAVAFSFVVSFFPFCIFLGALAGLFGGRELAELAVAKLFDVLPQAVAQGLAPQVDQIMGQTRIDLLTFGGAVALFFATSAIETMRTALNGAYRVTETRPYPLCLLISMAFVLFTAVSSLAITYLTVVGPAIALEFEPDWMRALHDSAWFTFASRYGIAAVLIAAQLLAFHLWLAAGQRSFEDVWPGVALSVVLWLVAAGLYSYYLSFSDYTRFYAGLSQLMVALIFFQVTAVIMLLGAELNRGLIELKRMGLVPD